MKQLARLALLAGLALLSGCEDGTPPTQSSTDRLAQFRAQSVHGAGPRVMRPLTSMASFTDTSGILYHGGPILPVTKVVAIYWATSTIYNNGPSPGTTGTGSQDHSLVGYFLNNLGGSAYFNINRTYYDTIGGGHTVGNVVTYTGFWADSQNVAGGRNPVVPDSSIHNEIIRGFNAGRIAYDSQTVYAVFSSGNTNLGGGFVTQYCSYHWFFEWNGHIVTYAALPYAYSQAGTCTSGLASPNNDAAGDGEVNVLAHELEESTTDFAVNAWYTASGVDTVENADKCVWQWGSKYWNGQGWANMEVGARDFLIQENWVNQGSGGCLVSWPWATISGRDSVRPNQSCGWWAHPKGGTPPYTYAWFPVGVQDDSEVVESFSQPGTYALTVWVTDSTGQRSGPAEKSITVTSSAPKFCPFQPSP